MLLEILNSSYESLLMTHQFLPTSLTNDAMMKSDLNKVPKIPPVYDGLGTP